MNVETVNGGSYSAPVWAIGAANFTDADPNVTPPTGDRILTAPVYVFSINDAPTINAATQRVSPCLCAFIADGTSVDVVGWWYDDVQLIWIRRDAALTITYATTSSFNSVIQIGHTPGRRYFIQITANVGATKVAMLIR